MLLGPQKPLNLLLGEIRRKAGRESLPSESGKIQVKAFINGVEAAITVTSESRGPRPYVVSDGIGDPSATEIVAGFWVVD